MGKNPLDAFGMTVSRTGTTPTPFGFVGGSQYQTDRDSGLLLLGHRYYDPSIGRFLSQDPIGDGSNWYAYCDNNPLTDTDATGLAPRSRYKPWDRRHAPYESADEAAKAALRGSFKNTGVEMGGWIIKVKGGFLPTVPQPGTNTGMKSYAPPGNAAGEYHTHPSNYGKLLPVPDNGDQWFADTGGRSKIRIPIYVGDQKGDIYKHTPRPTHKNDGPLIGRVVVIRTRKQAGTDTGVDKIGRMW